MKGSAKLVLILGSMVVLSVWVLNLQAEILAQTPEPARNVPESRQPMGLNLSPYREGGVPIDEQIVGDLENLGVKWMRFEFRTKGTPPNTYIPVEDYTVAAENLAAHGIEVLGLIDYTTLPWPKADWSTTDYREKFVSRTSDLVSELQRTHGAAGVYVVAPFKQPQQGLAVLEKSAGDA